MKTLHIATLTLLVVGFAAVPGFAASVTLPQKTTAKPAAPVMLSLEGAIGRVCRVTAQNGKLALDTNTCKPFTIPQQAVTGKPIEVTPLTTKSRSWISQGDWLGFDLACTVVYGWKQASCLPIKAHRPDGYMLGRKTFGVKGQGLQFVPIAKKSGALPFTDETELAAMQKYRAAVRDAMIAALTDIGARSHRNTRMMNDCGGGETPEDYGPELRFGAPQTANVICGEDADPGSINGGGGGFGGGYADGSGEDSGGPWTNDQFDDFAGQMVDMDFEFGMADFMYEAKKLPPGLMKCSVYTSNCKDSCGTLEKIENSGCATLGAAVGVLLKSASIGSVLTVYCGARVELATAECNLRCQTPTVVCQPD